MIDVAGEVDLNGTTIDLDLLAGFTPAVNQTFDLLTGTAITGLPVVDGSDFVLWQTGIVAGGNGQVLRVTYVGALVGDLNGDGFVGIADLNIVLGVWNRNVTPGDPLQGDPSGDGFVGIADLNVVLGNWNAGTPPANSANIPEPAALGVWLVSGLIVMRRR